MSKGKRLKGFAARIKLMQRRGPPPTLEEIAKQRIEDAEKARIKRKLDKSRALAKAAGLQPLSSALGKVDAIRARGNDRIAGIGVRHRKK